jgi:hypothetical protein
MRPETTHTAAAPSRPAAIALVAGTLLSMIAVAAHPTVSGGGGASQILIELVKGRAADEHVHAAVILLMGGYLFGFIGFAGRIGLHRTPVRLGLIAYGIGTLGMIGAALNDGFITPALAAAFVGSAPEKADVALAVLMYGWTAIQDLSKLGFIGMSLGMLGVSLPLLRERGFPRIVGCTGLISGVLPVAFLILAKADLAPPLLIAILAVQSIWNLAAAALLIHRRADLAPAGLSQPA